jgi:hypothetical protein
MEGSSSLLCTSSGDWNGTIPVCQCNVITFLNVMKFNSTSIYGFLFFPDATCQPFPEDDTDGLRLTSLNFKNPVLALGENITFECQKVIFYLKFLPS